MTILMSRVKPDEKENCYLEEICDPEIRAFEVEGMLVVLKPNQGLLHRGTESIIIYEQDGDSCKRIRGFVRKYAHPLYTDKELKELFRNKDWRNA